MTSRSKLAVLLLCLLAGTAAAQTGVGRTYAHDHSSSKKGGSTLAPSTLTVPGGVFSVGGSTLSVQNGGVSTSTLTVNTDAIVKSTLTVNGAAIVKSTLTVGGIVYGTTANYSSVIRGGWSMVASTNPSGSSQINFSGFNPNYPHRITFRLTQNTSAGSLFMRFNGDGGANYQDGNTRTHNTTLNPGGGSDTDTQCSFQNIATSAGERAMGSLEFFTAPDNLSKVALFGSEVERDATAAAYERMDFYCFYSGAANLTNMAFQVTAGTFTGFVYIEALVPSQGPP